METAFNIENPAASVSPWQGVRIGYGDQHNGIHALALVDELVSRTYRLPRTALHARDPMQKERGLCSASGHVSQPCLLELSTQGHCQLLSAGPHNGRLCLPCG